MVANTEPSLSPPLVTLENGFLIEGPLGQAYHVEAPDVERYVLRYGTAGWIVGLSDERKLYEAAKIDEAARVEVRGEQSGLHEPMRVSDLFLGYYLKSAPEDLRPVGYNASRAADRDALKRGILETLRQSSAKPDGKW